jgi:hypothetical protein
LVAALTIGCVAKLPSSAETVLLRRLHAEKIIKIHELRHRTIGDFDYLGAPAKTRVIREVK